MKTSHHISVTFQFFSYFSLLLSFRTPGAKFTHKDKARTFRNYKAAVKLPVPVPEVMPKKTNTLNLATELLEQKSENIKYSLQGEEHTLKCVRLNAFYTDTDNKNKQMRNLVMYDPEYVNFMGKFVDDEYGWWIDGTFSAMPHLTDLEHLMTVVVKKSNRVMYIFL